MAGKLLESCISRSCWNLHCREQRSCSQGGVSSEARYYTNHPVCVCIHTCVLGAGGGCWSLGPGEATCSSAAGHWSSCVCGRSQALEKLCTLLGSAKGIPRNQQAKPLLPVMSLWTRYWQSVLTLAWKRNIFKGLRYVFVEKVRKGKFGLKRQCNDNSKLSLFAHIFYKNLTLLIIIQSSQFTIQLL